MESFGPHATRRRKNKSDGNGGKSEHVIRGVKTIVKIPERKGFQDLEKTMHVVRLRTNCCSGKESQVMEGFESQRIQGVTFFSSLQTNRWPACWGRPGSG